MDALVGRYYTGAGSTSGASPIGGRVSKSMTLIKRPGGADRLTFCHLYLAGAGAAARRLTAVRRMTVDLVDIPAEEAGLRPGGEPSYDAVLELWSDDPTALDPGVVDVTFGIGATAHVYRVTETVERDYERSWPAGERSPGVKSIYLARRLRDMSQDEYAAYWGHRHAPLALAVHVSLWRYARNVVSEGAPGSDHWDGFAELHFRTAQDLRERFYDSEEGRRSIAEDVAKFTSGGRALHTSEYILKG